MTIQDLGFIFSSQQTNLDDRRDAADAVRSGLGGLLFIFVIPMTALGGD